MIETMDAERWERIAALYTSASDLESGARARFLARECAGDEELRHEVESLLAQNVSSDGLLERVDQGAFSWDPSGIAGRLPRSIGRYQIGYARRDP
jgi:hypothetical protein